MLVRGLDSRQHTRFILLQHSLHCDEELVSRGGRLALRALKIGV